MDSPFRECPRINIWLPLRRALNLIPRLLPENALNENVLLIFAETTNDVFVDGYVYNSNPTLGVGYPNYDILEIFIDENKSGGLHVFDGTGSTAILQRGKNAENAFSYYIVSMDQKKEWPLQIVLFVILPAKAGVNFQFPKGNFIPKS